MEKKSYQLPISPGSDIMITYVTRVVVGEVIKSESFENLLYRDILDQDPMLGFYVNPKIRVKNRDCISEMVMLSSPGLIKRAQSLITEKDRSKWINLKLSIPSGKEFVVIYTERNIDFPKEYENEDDRVGHYPLKVVAKMLGPDGDYDPNGIEVAFNMETEYAKHAVREVESEGVMTIKYKRAL